MDIKQSIMKTESFLKSREFKFLLPFIVVLGIIQLAKTGYIFGQWLHQIVN